MSQSSQAYEYKTAPIGGRARITVNEDSASIENAITGRGRKTVLFREIDGARWVETQLFYYGAPSMQSSELILKHKGGVWRARLGDGDPAGKNAANRGAYFSACAALLANAAKANPDLEIAIGSGAAIKWIMGAFGTLAVLIGLFLGVGGLGALLDREWADGVLFLALALSFGASGAAMAINFNPFGARGYISAADLALTLAEGRAPQ